MSGSSSASSRASAKRSAFQIAGPARRASASSASCVVAARTPTCVEREIAASEPIVSPSARSATVSADARQLRALVRRPRAGSGRRPRARAGRGARACGAASARPRPRSARPRACATLRRSPSPPSIEISAASTPGQRDDGVERAVDHVLGSSEEASSLDAAAELAAARRCDAAVGGRALAQLARPAASRRAGVRARRRRPRRARSRTPIAMPQTDTRHVRSPRIAAPHRVAGWAHCSHCDRIFGVAHSADRLCYHLPLVRRGPSPAPSLSCVTTCLST